jgi:hypothetical protein
MNIAVSTQDLFVFDVAKLLLCQIVAWHVCKPLEVMAE